MVLEHKTLKEGLSNANTHLIIVLVGILTLGSGLIATAGENDVELALVDFSEVAGEVLEEDGEIQQISQREVGEIAVELGYELVVDVTPLGFYLDGVLDSVRCLAAEDATEKVEDVIDDEDEIEEIKELDEVEERTDKVIVYLEN